MSWKKSRKEISSPPLFFQSHIQNPKMPTFLRSKQNFLSRIINPKFPSSPWQEHNTQNPTPKLLQQPNNNKKIISFHCHRFIIITIPKYQLAYLYSSQNQNIIREAGKNWNIYNPEHTEILWNSKIVSLSINHSFLTQTPKIKSQYYIRFLSQARPDARKQWK